MTDDKIRELRLEGLSERQIATALGITRHRVRTVLESFEPPAPIRGATWTEEVELTFGRAKTRKDDNEQMVLGVIALDAAEWLDAHEGDKRYAARGLGVSLRYVVQGVTGPSNPLVRLHARRARRLMAELDGRAWDPKSVEPEIAHDV